MNIKPVAHGQLHRLLFEHRFALVAASELEMLPSECPSLSTATGVLQDSDELLPRLVDLTRLSTARSAELLQACLEPEDIAAGPPICVLFESDADAQTVAAHLGRAQLAKNTRGEKAWLRLHDPRVWLQLNRVLNAERLNALMGPTARWTFFLGGQWCYQDNEGPRAMISSFDARTWTAFERIGVVNRVLARLKAETEKKAQSVSDLLGISQRVDELAERASEVHHLDRQDDQVEFCLLGLNVHARFDEHSQVRELLLRTKQDPAAFDELLSQDKAFWQSVGQTMTMTGEVTT